MNMTGMQFNSDDWFSFCESVAVRENWAPERAPALAHTLAGVRVKLANEMENVSERLLWFDMQRRIAHRFPELKEDVGSANELGESPLSSDDDKSRKRTYSPGRALTSCVNFLLSIDAYPKGVLVDDLPHLVLDLDLSGRGVSDIPEELSVLRRIRRLRISDNPLGVLPRWIWSLPRLMWLEAKNCGLTRIMPTGVAQESLQWLDARRNELEDTWRLVLCPELRAAIVDRSLQSEAQAASRFLPKWAQVPRQVRKEISRHIAQLPSARAVLDVHECSTLVYEPEYGQVSLCELACYLVEDTWPEGVNLGLGTWTAEPLCVSSVHYDAEGSVETLPLFVTGEALDGWIYPKADRDVSKLNGARPADRMAHIIRTGYAQFHTAYPIVRAVIQCSRKAPFLPSQLRYETTSFGNMLTYRGESLGVEDEFQGDSGDGSFSGGIYYFDSCGSDPVEINPIHLLDKAKSWGFDVGSVTSVYQFLILWFRDVAPCS
jgi:hypothetical protein